MKHDTKKTYIGTRSPEGTASVNVQNWNGYVSPLSYRLDVRNHSPTGFEWGYAGSGPAQLALAILADYLGNDREAAARYQRFKFDRIARLSRSNGWTMTGQDVEAWLNDDDACMGQEARSN